MTILNEIAEYTKKRYIDPFVVSKGRILENHDKMRNDVNAFLNASQNQKLIGEFKWKIK